MNDLKPGWRTSEFWLLLIGKAAVFAVGMGVVSQDKADEISSHLTTLVGAGLAVAALWGMANAYLHRRSDLKEQAAQPADNVAKTAAGSVLPFLLASLALGCLAGFAPAQQPAVATPPAVQTSLFGWREAIEIRFLQQRIAQLEAQQRQTPAPAPPPIIIQPPPAPPAVQAPAPQIHLIVLPGQQGQPHLAPPYQQIPIGGPPYQQIPIGGPPYQMIPLGPPPYQQIPLGPPPIQQIPIGQQPYQRIDGGGQPIQQIPLTPPGQARPQGAPPPGEARPQPPALPMPAAPAATPQRYVPAVAWRR